MKRCWNLMAGGLALLTMSAAMTTEASQVQGPASAGNPAFAVDLYGQLRGTEGNLFFSPYSISTALAMTYGGARGETAAQMATVRHFPAGQEELNQSCASLLSRLEQVQGAGNVKLNVANSLWPDQSHPFLDAYLSLIKKQYGATITPVDYVKATEAARVTINTWVEGKTQDKIKDLISPGTLDASTRLVLVNAIYFKGDWALQFDAKNTKEASFQVAANKSVQVSMMHQQAGFKYAETAGLQLLELPYAGNELSMLVLLPAKDSSLAALEASLTTDQLNAWQKLLGEKKVVVDLPKFKITWGTPSLVKALQALGMNQAFDADTADFSGMDGRRPGLTPDWLYISDVLHKAFVEVNEEGTEAAAATAVVMVRATSMPAAPPEFRADRPFIFLIQEKTTGSILFMGRVTDPTQG